jgi:hypothetical protein
VDTITTEFSVVDVPDSLPAVPVNSFLAEPQESEDGEATVILDDVPEESPVLAPSHGELGKSSVPAGTAESASQLEEEDGEPPAPDAFTDDWFLDEYRSEEVQTAVKTVEEKSPVQVGEKSVGEQPATRQSNEVISKTPVYAKESEAPRQVAKPFEEQEGSQHPSPAAVEAGTSLPAEEAIVSRTTYLVPPALGVEEGSVRMLTIILRSSGDKTRDVLRLRRIHGIVTSYPGVDRFAFHVFERGRGYLLEFPNNTIGICPELLNRLTTMIGGENFRLEPITFQ